ncbi:MAG: LURP-one-related family protein [Acidobacteriota bacterium]
MQPKARTFGIAFTIYDANQQEAFKVEGQKLSWSRKVSLMNLDGLVLVFIRQRPMSWHSRYEIYRQQQLAATVTQKLTFSGRQFRVRVPGQEDFRVQGSFTGCEFTFERGGHQVARASKKLWAWNGRYGIEIADGEDDLLILATSVVLDLIRRDSNLYS